MKKKTAPDAGGARGHNQRLCPCKACAKFRAAEFDRLVEIQKKRSRDAARRRRRERAKQERAEAAKAERTKDS